MRHDPVNFSSSREPILTHRGIRIVTANDALGVECGICEASVRSLTVDAPPRAFIVFWNHAGTLVMCEQCAADECRYVRRTTSKEHGAHEG